MKIPAFSLERYFAAHEFTAPHLLCGSDCESMTLKDLLDLEPGSRERMERLWLGYTESTGHPELRAQIAGLYKEIEPEHVLVHAGAEEAIFNFMNVTLGAGDHIVVHWPCYQSLFQVAESIGAVVTRWQPDKEPLSERLRPETKVVVLNVPHNPTGYLMNEAEFRETIKLVDKSGALLFCDEVYRGLEYEQTNRLPAACELSKNAVSLGVMSKSFGLPGLRIGWVATRNRGIYEAMASYKDYTTICNSAPSEFLATIGLKHREKLWARNRGLINENLALLDDFFARHKTRFTFTRPRAGCIAFPELTDGGAERFCAEALEKAGVLLAPSSRFAFGDHHFRIGFGRKSFAAALRHFDAFLG